MRLWRKLGGYFISKGYQEVILSSLCDQQLFIDKAGPEIIKQMYAFPDKSNRPLCLIPEATAVIDRLYKNDWSKKSKKSMKIFYVARCYRYERPQEGRYREFTQIGVEVLGGDRITDGEEVIAILKEILDLTGVDYSFNGGVKRGLDYYTEDGFEAECLNLGSQKQIAGGGRYATGIGFGIGLERLLLAITKKR